MKAEKLETRVSSLPASSSPCLISVNFRAFRGLTLSGLHFVPFEYFVVQPLLTWN